MQFGRLLQDSGQVAKLGRFLAAGGGEELGGKPLGRRQSLGDQLAQTRKAILAGADNLVIA